MKNPRFEKEDDLGPWKFPDASKIPCKDCALRAEDRVFPGGTVWEGATYSMCDAFNSKPHFILFDGEDCPYYIKDD